MNKKIIVLFTMIILSTSIFAEMELGFSLTPGEVLVTPETANAMEFIGDGSSPNDNIFGFHFGYSFAWLFYVSYDALIVPPWWVYQTTNYTDYDGTLHSGINAPGFINFLDIGIRPTFGPLYLLATVGTNKLYIHSDYEQVDNDNLGVNMRLGVGIKWGGLSINITGTSTYNDFDQLISTVNKIANQDQTATGDFLDSIIPSIGFVLHF